MRTRGQYKFILSCCCLLLCFLTQASTTKAADNIDSLQRVLNKILENKEANNKAKFAEIEKIKHELKANYSSLPAKLQQLPGTV
jgi:flagellar capping protein FliD